MSRGNAGSGNRLNWEPTPGPAGRNDCADPRHPVTIPNRPAPQGLALPDGGILLARKGGIALPRRKKIAKLFLYDASDKQVKAQKLIAREKYQISNKRAVSGIKSWKALADRILAYGEIGHLILAFHSYGGGLMIGNRIRDLDQKKVKDLFFPKSGKLPPKTDSISFEGCSIAQRPVRMANFARWFRARQVSGYTWFLAYQTVTIELPRGATVDSIRQSLKPFRDYVVTQLPSDEELAKKCRTGQVKMTETICYGSEDGTTTSFPLKPGQDRRYKPLSAARRREIKASAVDALQSEYSGPGINAFEHVIITFP